MKMELVSRFLLKFLSMSLLYLFATQITSVYADEVEQEVYMPPPPQYTSDAVVLMDASTGLVLYENEGNTLFYPASTTKIMTALIVLDHISDLSERVEFSNHAVFSIPRSSTHIAMDVGETLTVYEALYGLLLSSANEVSLALAEHVAGSVEEFVDLMNHRAAGLGAHSTHFVNPSGLPARGHVTTAYDMALIMREAVRSPIFTNIISTRRFDIPPTERQPEVRALLNDNRLIHPGPHHNEWVIGGKPGFTHEAGHTMVSYAQNNGRRLIASTLRGNGAGLFSDTTALLDYGFSLPFETVVVFDSSAYSIYVPAYQEINGSPTEIATVRLNAANDLRFDLPPDFDPAWLRYELSVPETLAPPVSIGDALGRVVVYVQNIRVGEVPLLAQDEVFAYSPVQEDAADLYQPIILEFEGYEPYESPQYERPFWSNEYVLTLAVPLALSFLALLISAIVYFARRKRRLRKLFHTRYARYPNYYRYR